MLSSPDLMEWKRGTWGSLGGQWKELQRSTRPGYTLYGGDSSTFLAVDKSTNLPTPPNVFPFSQQDATVSISSNPASPVTLSNVVALNGEPHTGNFSFNGSDTAFVDQGSVQFRYYTQEAGTFVSAVPEPETWAMMLIGLSLLGWRARRLKKSLA